MYEYQGGKEGGDEMNWEVRTDKYSLLYIKYITNENLLYSSGNSPQGCKCSECP